MTSCNPLDKIATKRAELAAWRRAHLAFINSVRVPEWVKRADLAADYRDTARDFGEHAAARHCRALLAEMRRVAA